MGAGEKWPGKQGTQLSTGRKEGLDDPKPMRATAACSAGGASFSLLWPDRRKRGVRAPAPSRRACRPAPSWHRCVAVPRLPLPWLRGSALQWHGTARGLLLLRFSNCSEPPLSERSGEETSDMGTGIWIVESCDSALLNMMLHEDQ